MRKRNVFMGVSLLGLVSVIFAGNLFATPPTIGPRGSFTSVVTIPATDAARCLSQQGCLKVKDGIDSTGPYFNFELDPGGLGVITSYTYRPRNDDCATCNVAYFGDGQIAAVRLFRDQYERWQRSQTPLCLPACVACAPLFTLLCSGGGPCYPPVNLRPTDFMLSDTCTAGTGGATLTVVFDPATNCFQDYEFSYAPL